MNNTRTRQLKFITFLTMKGGKWYMSQTANNLLKRQAEGSVIINSFLFGEGSGQLANDFFLKQAGTTFENNFLEKNMQDVYALVDEDPQDQMLKISLFGCLKYWNLPAETSESTIKQSSAANNLLSEVKFFKNRDKPSIIPGAKDLLKSVITPKNLESGPSLEDVQSKAEQGVYRNLLCLLGFISNACICLDNDLRFASLVQRYLCDYHLVSRFKPSKLTFNLETYFFFIVEQGRISMSSFDSLKAKIISGMRKSCRYFLEMSRNRVRIKHVEDSFLKYKQSQVGEGLSEGLSLRVRYDPSERKLGKKINGRELTRDMARTLLSTFSERNWREVDLFEIWDEVVQILKNEEIVRVIQKEDGEELEKEVIQVAKILASRDVSKDFVELKIEQ